MRDPYDDAALYDFVWGGRDDDLALYEQLARRGETPSLELGVGTGRVALHLARRGFDVVGVDASRPMLARLEAALDAETAPRLRLVEADMREFDLGRERFDLIYCAANSFQHLLTSEDQRAALRCVAKHLPSGGVFVAEVRPPSAVDWTIERSPLQLRFVRPYGDGEQLMQMFSLTAAPAAQTTTGTYIFDRVSVSGAVTRRMFDITLRYTGRAEMELLLASAGLSPAHVYGGVDLSPFDDASDRMIIVAQREGP